MPYLTCIGGHGTAGKNVGGTGSRGYWVFRRGRTVVIRYGAVQVRRSDRVWIEWLGEPREIKKPVGSSQAARKLIEEIVQAKTRAGHGYSRLKPGVRIW